MFKLSYDPSKSRFILFLDDVCFAFPDEAHGFSKRERINPSEEDHQLDVISYRGVKEYLGLPNILYVEKDGEISDENQKNQALVDNNDNDDDDDGDDDEIIPVGHDFPHRRKKCLAYVDGVGTFFAKCNLSILSKDFSEAEKQEIIKRTERAKDELFSLFSMPVNFNEDFWKDIKIKDYYKKYKDDPFLMLGSKVACLIGRSSITRNIPKELANNKEFLAGLVFGVKFPKTSLKYVVYKFGKNGDDLLNIAEPTKSVSSFQKVVDSNIKELIKYLRQEAKVASSLKTKTSSLIYFLGLVSYLTGVETDNVEVWKHYGEYYKMGVRPDFKKALGKVRFSKEN